MKNVKFLLSAALVFLASAALAQDFSGPQYAKWGATPEEREQNILNSNFLKESCDNRDYDAAAHYLKGLIDKIPDAAESIYQRGAVVYKNKINRAKSVAEKNMFIDSLMLMYDMRAQYFGDNVKPGKTAFILDQKAREFLRYKPNDRKGIREAFRAAIAQGGDSTDPETVVAYFSNLCEDYKNTDEVMPDEIIAEYDRLTPFFEKNPEAGDYKSQFDAAFGLSGAASCENLENLFRGKLEAAPDDEALLAQAVALMSRAKCDGDFLFLDCREILYGETFVRNCDVPCAGLPEQGRLYEGHEIPQRGACRRDGSRRASAAAGAHGAGRPGFQRHPGRRIGCPPGPRPESRGRCAVFRTGPVLRHFGSSL